MLKTRNLIIPKKWFLFFLILVLGVFAYVYFSKSSMAQKEDIFTQSMEKIQKDLERRWLLGDLENSIDSGQLKCNDLELNSSLVHSSFFECNAFYLDCYLSSHLAQKELSQKINSHQVNFSYETYRFDNHSNFIIQLKENYSKKRIQLRFRNTCRDTYLVQNNYRSGVYSKDGHVWDNYYRNIFVDKSYITNLDIYIWKNKNLNIKSNNLYKPATDLTKAQMKKFCSHRKSHLLQAHVLDAASYIPSSAGSDYIYLFPFPWTKKRDLSGIKTNKLCNHFIFKECKKYIYHSPYSPSWSGIFHTLGSYQELVDSKFENTEVKLSSRQLIRNSRSHQLGFRVRNNESYKNAFRCMVEK